MKRWLVIIIGVWALVASTTLFAQGNVEPIRSGSFSGAPKATDLVGQAAPSGFSLFDLSRLNIHHSYSLGYYSGGGRSGSIGMYMSTLEYQLSRPLTVRVGLGYLHQPLGSLGSSEGLDGGKFLPNVSLDFRPTENMLFILDYRTVPSWGYGTGYGRSRYAPRSESLSPLLDW